MSSGGNGGGDADDCGCCWRGCCRCRSRSGCHGSTDWFSIPPSSFPAGGIPLGEHEREAGESGRDGHPYLLKMLFPVRICIVVECGEGWTWLGKSEGWACGYHEVCVSIDRGTRANLSCPVVLGAGRGSGWENSGSKCLERT